MAVDAAAVPTSSPRSAADRQRLRLLGASALLYALAIPVWIFAVAPLGVLSAPHQLSLWVMVLACTAGAFMEIELHDYRVATTVSLMDIPLILGLFLAAPVVALPAYLIGGLVARTVRRRGLPVFKELLNGGQESLNVAAVYLVFHAFGPSAGSLFTGSNILAAGVAALALWITEEACFHVAYAAMTGKPEMMLSGPVAGLVTVLTNLSLGLGSLVFVVYQPWLALTMVPPLLLVVSVQQASTESRQRAQRIEFLFRTNEFLYKSADAAASIAGLLGEIVAQFHVARVELMLAPAGSRTLRLTADQSGEQRNDAHEFTAEEAALIAALDEGAPAVRTGTPAAAVLEPLLRARGATTGMAARIAGLDGGQGLLLLVESTGMQKRFKDADVTLLGSLAGQIRSALERGELSKALASVAAEKEEWAQQALHDPLTRLANRGLFNHRLSDALNGMTPASAPVAILFIDLDDFKLVNDTYGHAAGDEVLLTVADRLRTVSRPIDVPARFGGDEFGLLIENLAGHGNAVSTAQRVVASIGEPISIGETDVKVRASVGVAIVGGGMAVCDTAELLRRADAAMYVAKRSGKGQFAVYDPNAEALFAQDEREGVALQAALERDQIKVRYAPVIDLSDGTVVGARAMLRWQHPTRGLLAPEGFMAVAEKGRLVPALGRHLLADASQRLPRWHSEVPGLFVTVSIPERHFLQPGFIDEAVEFLTASGLSPHALVICLEQEFVTGRMNEVTGRLQSLIERGFGVGIDNFGRGGDLSLGPLRAFPFTFINLASDLSRSVSAVGGPDNEIVAGVLRVAALLNVTVVAAGVDNTAHADALRALGTKLATGPAWGEPVGAADFHDLLARGALVPTDVHTAH